MGLPLLFGIITYLFIIIFLTIWLTKYHARIYQGPNLRSKRVDQDQLCDQSLNPETGLPEKDSQTNLSSGNKSLPKNHKGVFHQDK